MYHRNSGHKIPTPFGKCIRYTTIHHHIFGEYQKELSIICVCTEYTNNKTKHNKYYVDAYNMLINIIKEILSDGVMS